ncbi:MAG: hypothetical protein ACRET5_11740 [Steroidobacteraceae bacterium]
MSRSIIWLLIGAYFVAAMIFGAFEFIEGHPFSKIDAGAIGWMISAGLVFFVGGGILPVIGWAFAGFRASHAAVPLIFWLLISSGLAYLSDYGSSYERNSKLQRLGSGNEGLTGKDRDDMVRSVKLTCIQNQTANPLTPKLGISAEKIAAYCDCMAEGMASAVSIDEIKVLISTGKAPTSVTDKATVLGNFCSKQAFAK